MSSKFRKASGLDGLLGRSRDDGSHSTAAVLIKEANILHPWHSVRYTYMQVAC